MYTFWIHTKEGVESYLVDLFSLRRFCVNHILKLRLKLCRKAVGILNISEEYATKAMSPDTILR
jgi:hypothetical protein